MNVVRDTVIVYTRELKPTLYEPFGLMFNLVQPLFFLVLFGPLLTGMPGIGESSPWQWFVPGILVMLALSTTTASAGYNLLLEMQTGSHERLLVTPLSRAALLIGRTLKEVVMLLAQAILIIALGMLFGFKLYPLGVFAGMLMLGVLGIGLGALSYALAIALRKQEWAFWMIEQTMIFPLLILSGMMLPLDAAPEWMRTLSRLNPVTYIVEGERALFVGDFSQSSVWIGAVVAIILASVGTALGIRSMRHAGD